MKMRFGNYPKTPGDLSACLIMYNVNKYPQRFGQWLYNAYVYDNAPWPELFYETDVKEAYSIALDEILKQYNQ